MISPKLQNGHGKSNIFFEKILKNVTKLNSLLYWRNS